MNGDSTRRPSAGDEDHLMDAALTRYSETVLGPLLATLVDQLREGAIATYVDAQLTMMLTRISAGEDPELVRAHAHLAFAVLTNPTSTRP